jgi:hypothetical protein
MKPKVEIHVKPEPQRKDSFWFDGHVATVTDGKTTVNIIATGHVDVTFNRNDENCYRNSEARKEARSRGYTDRKLNTMGRHDGWGNNNWFAFEVITQGKSMYWDEGTETKFDDAIHAAKEIIKEINA